MDLTDGADFSELSDKDKAYAQAIQEECDEVVAERMRLIALARDMNDSPDVKMTEESKSTRENGEKGPEQDIDGLDIKSLSVYTLANIISDKMQSNGDYGVTLIADMSLLKKIRTACYKIIVKDSIIKYTDEIVLLHNASRLNLIDAANGNMRGENGSMIILQRDTRDYIRLFNHILLPLFAAGTECLVWDVDNANPSLY